MNEKSEEYKAYIKSPDWQMTRGIAKARAGYKCEKCGSPEGLQVHHKTYDRLGHEWPTDLMVLCDPCHVKEHRAIERKRAEEFSDRVYYNGLDTYMSKKYGDTWELRIDQYRAECEFDAWLERKGR